MKWPLGPGPTTLLAGGLVSLLARTWRFESRGEARWEAVRREGAFVYLLWHEALLPLLWHHRRQGVAIVVSEARDGQYLAAFAHRLGYRRILGSSTRGGVRALIGAIRALEAGTNVAFTPDGPRGPRREVKPGILAAAARAGVPVLPVHASATRAWRLRSWDRFMIPKPGARVRVGYGVPFRVEGGDEGLAAGATTALDALRATEMEIAWRHDEATAID